MGTPKYRKSTPLLLALLSLTPLASPARSLAGTYNFYFNNTEQGDNSTATPNLVVKDGVQVQPSPAASPSASSPNPTKKAQDAAPPVRETYPATEAASGTSRHDAGRDSAKHPSWLDRGRIGVAASGDSVKKTKSAGVFDSDPQSSLPFWEQKTDVGYQKIGYMVSATYFFTDFLGATLNLGSLSGLEAEFSPFWAKENTILVPALLVGVMASGSAADSTSSSAAYGGLRLEVRLGSSISLMTAARASFTDSPDFSFRQIQAGLTFRL